MKTFALIFSTSALLALVSGCASGGAYEPQNTAKFNYEETAKFVLFDADAQHSVTCPGVQVGKTADGRMKVTAHLRNRENRRIEVQANCKFKDAQGYAVDETPFRTVILDENATDDVSFESFKKDVTTYEIRVRQAR